MIGRADPRRRVYAIPVSIATCRRTDFQAKILVFRVPLNMVAHFEVVGHCLSSLF